MSVVRRVLRWHRDRAPQLLIVVAVLALGYPLAQVALTLSAFLLVLFSLVCIYAAGLIDGRRARYLSPGQLLALLKLLEGPTFMDLQIGRVVIDPEKGITVHYPDGGRTHLAADGTAETRP